jgi:hypothetical protein
MLWPKVSVHGQMAPLFLGCGGAEHHDVARAHLMVARKQRRETRERGQGKVGPPRTRPRDLQVAHLLNFYHLPK